MFVLDSLLHWWLGGLRLLLGLAVVILATVTLWSRLNRPLRVGGAVAAGLSGILIVDNIPILSSVVPREARRGVQVGIGIFAGGFAAVNLVGWWVDEGNVSTPLPAQGGRKKY